MSQSSHFHNYPDQYNMKNKRTITVKTATKSRLMFMKFGNKVQIDK